MSSEKLLKQAESIESEHRDAQYIAAGLFVIAEALGFGLRALTIELHGIVVEMNKVRQ